MRFIARPPYVTALTATTARRLAALSRRRKTTRSAVVETALLSILKLEPTIQEMFITKLRPRKGIAWRTSGYNICSTLAFHWEQSADTLATPRRIFLEVALRRFLKLDRDVVDTELDTRNRAAREAVVARTLVKVPRSPGTMGGRVR